MCCLIRVSHRDGYSINFTSLQLPIHYKTKYVVYVPSCHCHHLPTLITTAPTIAIIIIGTSHPHHNIAPHRRAGTIGDDQGSSPWAFKIKMHLNVPSHVSGLRIVNTKFGNITSNTWQDPGDDGGTAIQMGMNYAGVPVDPTKGQP